MLQNMINIVRCKQGRIKEAILEGDNRMLGLSLQA